MMNKIVKADGILNLRFLTALSMFLTSSLIIYLQFNYTRVEKRFQLQKIIFKMLLELD